MTAPSDAKDMDDGGTASRPLRDGIDTARTHLSDAAEAARDKAAKAVDAAKDGLGQAKDTLGGAYATSRDTAVDVIASSRERASDLLATGRDRAGEAYAAARESAKAAGETASERLEASPLVALIGGIAAGVVIAALLPRTEQETKVLGGVGKKLNALAQEALDAAKEAGQAKLDDLGLTPDKARESVSALIDGVMAAATSAGSAAVDTTRAKVASEPQVTE